jgi:hypothetical protein
LRRKFRGALGEGLDLGGVSVQGESAMAARRREEGSPSPVYGKTHLELVRGKVDLVCEFRVVILVHVGKDLCRH